MKPLTAYLIFFVFHLLIGLVVLKGQDINLHPGLNTSDGYDSRSNISENIFSKKKALCFQPPAFGSITGNTTVCARTANTYSISPVPGAISYTWTFPGDWTGSSTTTSINVIAGYISGIISVVANTSGGTTNPQILSVTVIPDLPPVVFIGADTNGHLCNSFIYKAIPHNEGPGPTYQWTLNGNNVCTDSISCTLFNITYADKVSVNMTSNSPCYPPTTVNSGTLEILVPPPPTPSVIITIPSNNICTDSSATFTAISTNGGTQPIFQWKKNGNDVGTNSSIFTTNSLANGDTIIVEMVSNDPCATIDTVYSNTIVMKVINNLITPSLDITASPVPICFGTTTFIATSTNSGLFPTFQWKLNNINVGRNEPIFESNTLKNGDTIKCIMTSNTSCGPPRTVNSNYIIVTIDPASCPIGFYMPTGFTPNNDGKNDLCKPLLFGDVVSYKFSIYNKWGQKVFETTDLRKGWDGKIKDAQINTNVFVWFCSFQFQGGVQEFRKGTVMLIR